MANKDNDKLRGIKNFYQKLKNVFSKKSESGKEKREHEKQYKKTRPQGFIAQRIGMGIAWFVIGVFVLSTLSNLLFSGGSSSDDDEEDTLQEVNFLYADGGNEFAKDFLEDFYNWNHEDYDGEDGHYEELKDYFITDVQDKISQIAYDGDWSSSVDRDNISLKNIDKISNNKAYLTYEVDFKLSRSTEEKDSKIDKKEMSNKEYKERMKKPIYKDGEETVNASKYVEVPIYFDDDSEQFVVYDSPKYTNYSDGDISNVPKFDIETLDQITETDVTNNVGSFLDTFFESYAEDTEDKLSYLVDESNVDNGLEGTMTFNEVKEYQVFALSRDDKERLFIEANVSYNDPEAEDMTFETDYLLTIKEKEGSYIVESINDESYVKGIIAEYRNELDEEDDDDEQQEKINKLEELDDINEVEYKKDDENKTGQDTEDGDESNDDNNDTDNNDNN